MWLGFDLISGGCGWVGGGRAEQQPGWKLDTSHFADSRDRRSKAWHKGGHLRRLPFKGVVVSIHQQVVEKQADNNKLQKRCQLVEAIHRENMLIFGQIAQISFSPPTSIWATTLKHILQNQVLITMKTMMVITMMMMMTWERYEAAALASELAAALYGLHWGKSKTLYDDHDDHGDHGDHDNHVQKY